MNVQIPIFDQQQVPVKASASQGKADGAKRASSEQKSFKSTLNKALDGGTEKEKTVSAASETKTATGEDKIQEEMVPIGITPLIVPVEAIQPTIEAPATVLMESMGGKSTEQSMDASADVPASIISPTGIPFSNPDSMDIPASPEMKSSTREITAAPIPENSPPITVEPDTAVPSDTGTFTTNKSANLAANLGQTAQEVVETTDVVTTPLAANPVEVEPPVEKKGEQVKDAFTTVTAVVAGVEEQLSNGHGFNTDTSGNNPTMVTSMGAIQAAKAEAVNMPFPAVDTPPPIKEQVLQEVVQKARFMSNGTQQSIQIQLKPENLGPLNVQIAVDNGAVTAKFQTDNPQVKQALEASLNQLKQDLQTQGFKVQHVAVSIAQQGMSFSDFSRRAPQFALIKSKRVGAVDGDAAEQFGVKTAQIENYGGVSPSEVDYKI